MASLHNASGWSGNLRMMQLVSGQETRRVTARWKQRRRGIRDGSDIRKSNIDSGCCWYGWKRVRCKKMRWHRAPRLKTRVGSATTNPTGLHSTTFLSNTLHRRTLSPDRLLQRQASHPVRCHSHWSKTQTQNPAVDNFSALLLLAQTAAASPNPFLSTYSSHDIGRETRLDIIRILI